MLQDQKSSEQPCPCQSGKPFNFCCAPAINGSRPAATAEALMRSRYSAFSIGAVDYLIDTTAPEKRLEGDHELLSEQTQFTLWTGLEIQKVEAGQAEDTTGSVTFRAHFETPEERGTLEETSQFRRDEQGRWLYVEGDVNFSSQSKN